MFLSWSDEPVVIRCDLSLSDYVLTLNRQNTGKWKLADELIEVGALIPYMVHIAEPSYKYVIVSYVN